MKAFISGCIVGIAASVLASLAYRNLKDHRAPVTQPTENHASDSVPKDFSRDGERFSKSETDSASCEPEKTTTIEECIALFNRDAGSKEQALASEPRDPAWSPASEQQLQQFISTQRTSQKFQVESIDCRTTFCEIKATGGPGNESIEAFQNVMEEARRQLGFRPGASDSSDDGTRVVIRQRLNKP
jgi:hypothetical protein